MSIDLKAVKFKNQYNKMSYNSQMLLNKLIVECDKKLLTHTSTDTPDYRIFIEHAGKNSKLNYCLIKLKTREDLIKIHLRTDGYKILQNDKLRVNRLDRHNYNGKEWCEVTLKSEKDIELAVDYIMQVYRNIMI